MAPETRETIIAAYEENEAAAKRLVPFMTLDDLRLCREMAAEECGVSDKDVRSVLLDHFTMMGAG